MTEYPTFPIWVAHSTALETVQRVYPEAAEVRLVEYFQPQRLLVEGGWRGCTPASGPQPWNVCDLYSLRSEGIEWVSLQVRDADGRVIAGQSQWTCAELAQEPA